ncbi:hypothetical protein SAMN05428957_102488 [Oryzisolibacter propanilivorax]|uniref:Uncharacterized protein n=1 Tax=Oryzisolibacter propanilivorax TaxID=1527607 RepID=A0A1G9QQ13_9BURK|nr:hypothetical protein [Oryzisolibacter propanilivorax]SDM13086.1 hypothetical protein SAMN05428957_102488 [Oryzisolibacter propanilivorax]
MTLHRLPSPRPRARRSAALALLAAAALLLAGCDPRPGDKPLHPTAPPVPKPAAAAPPAG